MRTIFGKSYYLTLSLSVSDGLIEQFEFIKALEQMEITDNTTMFHHWSIMDEDKDGTVTLEEFDKEK